MNGRRGDDPRWTDRARSREAREDEEAHRRSPPSRAPEWSEHGGERGPERRADWDAEEDWQPRAFDTERYFRAAARERDARDYEHDLDYGRAAHALDRAREYGRDFDLDRELDRRARELDPERIARRHGYSPSGTFRDVEEDRRLPRGGYGRDRHGRLERSGGPEAPGPRGGTSGYRGADTHRERVSGEGGGMDRGRPWRGVGRLAETDVRYGGTQPAGHGPGVENMAPPWGGYATSRSRLDDHELGHGGFEGGMDRPARPMRPPRGRAPRGYRRSSERILADLCDGLMRSWVDAEDVDIRVRDGVVLLSGVVRSADERHATEALARDVLGVKEVINDIRVHRDEGITAPPAPRRPVQYPGFDELDDDTLHS